MPLLLKALRANFQGYEPVRQILMSSPSYGNNDPYADAIGLELDTMAQQFCIDNEKALGYDMGLRMVTVTGNISHGTDVSALPTAGWRLLPCRTVHRPPMAWRPEGLSEFFFPITIQRTTASPIMPPAF